MNVDIQRLRPSLTSINQNLHATGYLKCEKALEAYRLASANYIFSDPHFTST
jgi:hypothetical protein